MFKSLRYIRPDTVFIFVPASIFLALGIYLFIDTFVRNVSIFPLGLSTVLPPVLIVLGLIGVGVAYFVEKESRFRRESEEKFRNLIESVPVGIEVSTPKGEIIEANSALIKLFGYGSKEELLSKPVSSHYYDPGDREIFVESLERDGIVRDFEVRLNRKDGEECWGSISSVREKGEGGYRYVKVIQDITERKRAEDARRESEAKYRKVINTTSEGFWKFNNNTQIVEVNEAFLGMVGYDLDEVRGRSVYDFVKDESMETMKKQVSRIPASDHRRYELVLKSKEDEGVHVICNGTTIWDKDGKPMGAFAFITEIADSGDKG
jgi:PAS domain S-box-containing protein